MSADDAEATKGCTTVRAEEDGSSEATADEAHAVMTIDRQRNRIWFSSFMVTQTLGNFIPLAL